MPKVTKSKGAAAAADELLPAAATMTDIEAGVEGMEAEDPSTTGDAAAAGGSGAVKPKFPPLSSYEANGRRIEFRRVPVPQVRRGLQRFLGAVELPEGLHVFKVVRLWYVFWRPAFASNGCVRSMRARPPHASPAWLQNRMTPLKNNWLALYKPVTENLKLDMRMNLKTRKVGWAHHWPKCFVF